MNDIPYRLLSVANGVMSAIFVVQPYLNRGEVSGMLVTEYNYQHLLVQILCCFKSKVVTLDLAA